MTYVLYYPGACGMFLTAVLASGLGFRTDLVISESGHCHDLGNGIYVDTENITVVGWHWHRALARPKSILNGHFNDLQRVKQDFPRCKVILIDVADQDIPCMTSLRFHKTMNPMSQKEYKKFVERFHITEWPSFDHVRKHPTIIKQSITELDAEWFKEWRKAIDHDLVDIRIPFMQLFDANFCSVKQLLNIDTNSDIKKFIREYQLKNHCIWNQ